METIDRLIDTRELQEALEQLAHDITNGYKDKLIREDHKATGQLLASIQTDVEVAGTTYSVRVTVCETESAPSCKTRFEASSPV